MQSFLLYIKVRVITCLQLFEKLEEMKWLVSKGYFDTIQSTSKKIKGYFKGENEITIGKKSIGSEIKIILEEANINSIVTRKYYLFDKNHLSIQAQIGALGVYLGYISKMAKGDKNRIIYETNMNTVCVGTMENLDLSNLESKESRDKIDYVDVIWTKNKLNNITVAFEVEFNGKWDNAIYRLGSVSLASEYSSKVTNVIISEKESDFFAVSRKVKMDMITRLHQNIKFAHITIQRLIEILALRDKEINSDSIEKRFFDELTYI